MAFSKRAMLAAGSSLVIALSNDPKADALLGCALNSGPPVPQTGSLSRARRDFELSLLTVGGLARGRRSWISSVTRLTNRPAPQRTV
jgi:hypothetical protein